VRDFLYLTHRSGYVYDWGIGGRSTPNEWKQESENEGRCDQQGREWTIKDAPGRWYEELSFVFFSPKISAPPLACSTLGIYCGYIKNWAHSAGPESKSYNILNGGRSILKLARGIFTPYRPNDLYL